MVCADQDGRRSLEKLARDAFRDSETGFLEKARCNDVSSSRDGVVKTLEAKETPGDGEIGGTESNNLDSAASNAGTLLGDPEILRSANREGMVSTNNIAGSEALNANLALKVSDLPILRPPEAFGAPIFRCRAPTLAWQHCSCLSHSHLPPRRSSVIWSALKCYNQEPFYRTWPNRTARRFVRPSRRTVGTQSSLDRSRSSLGAFRCVVRSIDMTERSMDLEIGATIPF